MKAIRTHRATRVVEYTGKEKPKYKIGDYMRVYCGMHEGWHCRSRGGVSFGWSSQSESHTLVYLNHDNTFVALPN
jgi:hypothetical protein